MTQRKLTVQRWTAALCGIALLATAACADPPGSSGDGGVSPADGAAGPADAASPFDAATESWALYTIPVGSHAADVTMRQPGSPLSAFSSVSGRDFRFRLNPSAMYIITRPVQPSDQFDWNKLPGISDCGTVDLSVNGAMFGWRWRLDTTPKVLEVTAYANNNSTHLTPPTPLFTLDADDLTSDTPLRYRVWLEMDKYQFSVSGQIRGRMINATATLPRSCPTYSTTGLKWAAGFYFGGTSTAPSIVTALISEIPYAP